MASGKIWFSKPNGSSMSGYIAWSSVSNGSKSNSSKVTATVYLKKSSSVTTTGTFSGKLTIDGTSYSISKYGTWKNSYVVVGTKSKTVSHNSDGSKSIRISASLSNSGTTQAGTYSASATVALDKIPRASSISSSGSWIAGNALTVSISRKSTSFTHKVSVKVGSTTVASKSSVATGTTFSGAAFNNAVVKAMGQQNSADTVITVATYSGSTQIGSAATVKGKVTVPKLNSIICDDKAYIGSFLDITINGSDKRISHSLKYSFYSKSGSIENSSTDEEKTLYSLTLGKDFYEEIPNDLTGICTLTLANYFAENGATPIRIGEETVKKVTISAEGSKPLFKLFSFSDNNERIHPFTGNDQVLVSGYSGVECVIPVNSRAIAVNGATMEKYILSVGSKTEEVKYSETEDVRISISEVDSGTISVKAVDSRKEFTEIINDAKFIPYFSPSVKSISLERENMVGEVTTLTMEINMFCGSFGSMDNEVTSCTYRYRKISEDWSDDVKTIEPYNFKLNKDTNIATLSVHIAGDIADAETDGQESIEGGFALAGSYEVEVCISDILSSTSANAFLESGYPALYVKKMESEGGYQLGVNCVPDESMGSGVHVEGKSVTLNGIDLAVPIGAVMGWFSDMLPANWLLLDGSEVSRSEYADLFSVLGTVYGEGDGSTTFNIPNMKSRVAVGKNSSATAFASLGKTGGASTHTLTTAQIPAHTHGSAGSHTHFIKNTNGTGSGYVRLESYASAASTDRSIYTNSAGAHTHSSVGSGSAHNNLQPYIVLNYIMKAR